VCPVIPTSNQDGHQGQNRKKGGWHFNCPLQKILSYMLKSSSCLYSSNLGTFWLKIEQFWPFEEISLWNYWANLNQTLLKRFLDGPLPNLCPVIPTSNQDGHQAQNRKKRGWNFNCPLIGIFWLKEKFHRKIRNIC
jgi:hypothetical protein